MSVFKVWLDGELYREEYACMGSYDVANELFGDSTGYAKVARVDRDDGKYEFVLLDHGWSRLVAERLVPSTKDDV